MLIRIRFTIMAKGLLLVAVPLLFQLVLIGFITENGRQEHDADLSVAHSRVVLQQADRLLTRLGYAQTGIRGYVLTGNPVFAEPYDLAEQELPQRFDALKALLSDIPKQQAVLESIAIKTADWFVFHKENMRLVQIGARDEAVARIAGLTGKKQMDDIQREIAAFQTEMERLADERSQLRELNHTSFKWVIVVGTGVSVLLAVLLAVVFTRGISRRLAVLLANIHRLVQGRELTPPVGGSDEIATVDQTFREMAQTLAQSRDELAKHNRVLQSMLDNMGDGVIVVDETGKFLVFNPAAKRIMGMGPTDGTPGEWSDRYGVYLPDQTTLCPSEQLPIARAMRGEEVDAEEFFVRNPDKSAGTWITITARPLKDDCGLSRGGVAVFQDVTSRKQAEREMQRAFRLLDAARDAIFIFNLQTLRFSYVNQGAIEQVGYSRDELLQMTVLDIKSEFDELRFRQMIEPVLSGSVPSLTFSTIHRHKNGRNVPVEANLQCVTDASGTRSFVAIVRDITERQRIEKALRESEERLSLALKSGDVGTWSWDIANNSIIWDDYHHSLYGLQPGTFSGGYEDFMKLLHPEDRERVERAIVRSTQEDEEFENEYRVVWTDGSTHVLSTRGKVYRNETDQPQRMSGVTWDITEQRRNEAAMRQSDARNRAVLTTSLDAIITMDHQGRVVEFNPAAERVFGYAHDKVIGQDLAELIIPARFRDPHRQGMVRFRATGKARVLDQRLELSAVRADGSEFPIELTITQTSVEGPPVFTGFIRDITERKQHETQLAQSREAAESANRAKSDFLAAMSHELRTPLNGILGMNELLMNTELTERQRQFVEAGSTSGKALLQQINDLLDLSKIEAGKLDLELRECRLETLVFDVADVFTHIAQLKGYPLHCHFDPTACMKVLCDDNRIRQILVNLLGNAVKFTKAGGVTLRAESKNWLDYHLTMRFSVTDTGRGIPEDRRDLLFAPFTQVDNSTSREFGGTGLGLSICKQLVEMMGGHIGFESQLGVGSTFWFEVTLPLVAEDSVIGKRRDMVDGQRVLVVNGVDTDVLQVVDCLQVWGCLTEKVATVQNALEAIARTEAAGVPFAVVLVHCQLVVGDEFVLLQKLATQSRLPIIGLGTNPDDETIAYLHQLGVRHVLRDPVRPSALFNALASVLSVDAAHLPHDDGQGETHQEQPSRLSGHVLVAEDNHINQMFIAELLKHYGCTCDVAANGDEALEARQHQRYDLVLMDCQMPERDGFTATREIRRREAAGELPSRLPIIALTANALKGDRERCLEAGMDDYLSKPIDSKQLQAMLKKFLLPQID